MENITEPVTKSTRFDSKDTSTQLTNTSTARANPLVEKSRNLASLYLHVSTEEMKVGNVNQISNNVDSTLLEVVKPIDQLLQYDLLILLQVRLKQHVIKHVLYYVSNIFCNMSCLMSSIMLTDRQIMVEYFFLLCQHIL